MIKNCIFLFLTVFNCCDMCARVLVETKYGKIEGFDYKAVRGFETEVFLGIPFAKPPIGELRFEKPEPSESWSTTLQAKTPSKPCLTWPPILNMDGQEDCLYLNIIRPKNSSGENLPVMVFIHGGAFLIGSALDANYEKASDRLVSKNGIILVTIQYRLGIFGFFSTGDETNSGNLAIWDQIQALKFVQEIIENFGGDPNRVTIFGESAGGGSVSLLTLIDEADGLFSKSIPMSGSIEANWGLTEYSVKTSKKFLNVVGCHGNSKEQKNCIKKLSSEKIIDGMKTFINSMVTVDNIVGIYFGPRIDGNLIKSANFEKEFGKRTKKQSLIGLCSQESIIFALKFPGANQVSKYLPMSIEDAMIFNESRFDESVRFLLSQGNPYGTNQDEALDDVINFYQSQKSNYKHHQMFQVYVQLLSDLTFNIPSMREAIQKKTVGHEVFFYVFDFTSKPNPLADGTPHAADVFALFGGNAFMPDIPFDGVFEIAGDNFAELLVNFAKNDFPSVGDLKAPEITMEQISFIRINAKPELEINLWPERLAFWDRHSKKYGFDWPTGRKIVKTNKEEL